MTGAESSVRSVCLFMQTIRRLDIGEGQLPVPILDSNINQFVREECCARCDLDMIIGDILLLPGREKTFLYLVSDCERQFSQ